MQVVFLGTSGSWPTPKRNVSAVAIKRGPEVILFDCGEGTQRQFMLSKLSFMQVSRVFVSHFHGDHFLGLPGMVQSMSMKDRKSTRLNSSHANISYAVFCLKKKNKNIRLSDKT